MVGTFFVVSTVLCLNLYIALLSETFNRVYQNATANASLLQANTIIQLEHTLTKKKKKEVIDYLQADCGPLVSQVIFKDHAENKAGRLVRDPFLFFKKGLYER